MYNKILIVSGTTEGRELSKHLSDNKISHYVFVASEYGESIMDSSEYSNIHVGRLDEIQMEDYLKANGFNEDSLIVDASHPYATLVSTNITKAADNLKIKKIRVHRKGNADSADRYCHYDSIEKVTDYLNNSQGNVLVTTGSKEIGRLCEVASSELINRLYVRVLPTIESINLCINAGVINSHIIAMHGPFTYEMNSAIIRQYDIKHLITKDSGNNGGLVEKLEAAESNGCMCHIIDRPVKEDGISVSEAAAFITGRAIGRTINISILGAGMGCLDNQTKEVIKAIDDADVIFGAERLIKDIKGKTCHNMYLAKDIIPAIENGSFNNVAVLYSGDTGFFSGAAGFVKEVSKWKKTFDGTVNVNIMPGISSVSYLFAKIMESYEDAFIYSLHGRGSIGELVKACRYNRKCFALLNGDEDIRKLAEELIKSDISPSIYVGTNLSYESEEIVKLTCREALTYKKQGIASVILINDEAIRRPLINLKRDEQFIRDKVPMTKECIRHESVIRLGVSKGDIVYDIGAGTGSVSIEIAELDESLTVYAIEKKAEAVELISQNLEKHGITNVNVVMGDALSEVKTLIENEILPDCVFIGGSSGQMEDILRLLSGVKKKINVVINAVSLETISEVNSLINKLSVDDVRISQIAVSNADTIGNYHLMKAENPVTIFSFAI